MNASFFMRLRRSAPCHRPQASCKASSSGSAAASAADVAVTQASAARATTIALRFIVLSYGLCLRNGMRWPGEPPQFDCAASTGTLRPILARSNGIALM